LPEQRNWSNADPTPCLLFTQTERERPAKILNTCENGTFGFQRSALAISSEPMIIARKQAES
jgi:hypothetical protein